jgi:hypothetical protein
VSLPRLERFDLPRIDLPRIELPAVQLPGNARLRGLHGDRGSRGRSIGTLLLAGVAGAVLAYFLDPERGRGRRAQGRDRVLGSLRKKGRRAGRAGRHAASDVQGWKERAFHEYEGDPAANDETIAQRVQSEIFRDPSVPKGRVNVNVEGGIVVLRGELEDAAQAYVLERLALDVPGVRGVENLIHASSGSSHRHED